MDFQKERTNFQRAPAWFWGETYYLCLFSADFNSRGVSFFSHFRLNTEPTTGKVMQRLVQTRTNTITVSVFHTCCVKYVDQ